MEFVVKLTSSGATFQRLIYSKKCSHYETCSEWQSCSFQRQAAYLSHPVWHILQKGPLSLC